MLKMTKLRRKLKCIILTTVITTLAILTWASKLTRKNTNLEQDIRETRLFPPTANLRGLTQTRRDFAGEQEVQIHQQIPHSWNGSDTKEYPKTITLNQYIYRDYDVKTPRHVTLQDDHGDYFIKSDGIRCLREGTKNITSNCSCKEGWHGINCSIPDTVEESRFTDPSRLRLREGVPRRIIYGICFNMEFEMLEIRMRDMGDLIDLILIVESNYTGYREPKPLYLLEKLKRGFLQEYQEKMVHIFLDHFPPSSDPRGDANSYFYTNDYSGKGLQLVHGTRKDDIFIVADADELHSRETLLFLKHHDGYPEPVGGYLRRNAFGFFWCSGVNLLGFACSLDMLESVYKNKVGELRGATSTQHKFARQLEQYKTNTGKAVQMWSIGSPSSVSKIAGWHCSWCFEPERVRMKLLFAFNMDFPRWGDYPNKTKLDFIRKLIKVGLWFDEKSTFKPMYIGRDTPYAPPYVLNNLDVYKHLLFNPYQQL